jgi:hypothetical protein
MCSPFILNKREQAKTNISIPYSESDKKKFRSLELSYLRRDFEKVALECWLYQCNIGYLVPINVIDSKKNKLLIAKPDYEGEQIVRNRIKEIKRDCLFRSSYSLLKLLRNNNRIFKA